MKPPLYALVAYVQNPIGDFAENLRRELHPAHPDWPAHITILPPRNLAGTEAEALAQLANVCGGVEPFEIAMGDVETFAPITPTVFIRVAHAAYRMRELHDHLNTGALHMDEPWPYMPHLTIAKLDSTEEARNLLKVARERWTAFRYSRCISIDRLAFVREGDGTDWVDLALIPLGRRLAVK